MNQGELRAAARRRAAQVHRVLSLVTDEWVRWQATSDPGGAWLELPGERRIGTSGRPIALSVQETLSPSSGALVVFAARYTIVDFETRREIFAYHRHPPRLDRMHLHVGSGAGQLIAALHRAHLPAGDVSLPDIIEVLVEDFGVRPLRADWQAVLRRP
ncbi:MAG: hypothetical protein IT303_04230 [Dehalococcoidia bacterium]|nr:hypothetical protein [Dehalococcoidia bacterium]